MDYLEEVFYSLRDVLAEKDEVRDLIQECVRSIVRLSKTVLSLIHRGLLEEARVKAEGFTPLLSKLLKLRKLHEEFDYSGSIATAYQEYCEAKALLTYLCEGRIPSWEELSSPPIPYVLGLLDMVGELRRLILENIRLGEVEEAERLLKLMDTIYDESMKIDSPYAASVGLRARLDRVRRVIEATRGELIIEIRRRSLENAIRRLEEALRSTHIG